MKIKYFLIQILITLPVLIYSIWRIVDPSYNLIDDGIGIIIMFLYFPFLCPVGFSVVNYLSYKSRPNICFFLNLLFSLLLIVLIWFMNFLFDKINYGYWINDDGMSMIIVVLFFSIQICIMLIPVILLLLISLSEYLSNKHLKND